MQENPEAYIATGPKYKSVYYTETGYPDDGFGVCADVTAQTLRGAGYDLVALLDADVRANSAAYGIDEPGAAIDFRRVRNQKVFFDRHTALHTWPRPGLFETVFTRLRASRPTTWKSVKTGAKRLRAAR